jgi:hypothetical protein
MARERKRKVEVKMPGRGPPRRFGVRRDRSAAGFAAGRALHAAEFILSLL